MFGYAKYILMMALLVCSLQLSFAQPNAGNLPSLIDNEQDDNDQSGSDKLEDLVKQKMFVKVFTNKTKAFVGEPVLATYKFYVASYINDRPAVTKQPEFSGCSVKELNFDQGPEYEDINNEAYSVYTIRKVQLTPLQEGSLSLGKAYVNNDVQVRDPSNLSVFRRFNIDVSNADVTVDITSLPETGKPADFYGITGSFIITAVVAKNKIPVGENGHLTVTVRGAGNLDAIVQPTIEWPATIQHFDSKDSQHVSQDNFPVTGDRIFDIPFIGKQEGSIIIPAIKFSYFNTDAKEYKTITTDSIPVTFSKALDKKDAFGEIVNYDITNRKYLWIVAAIGLVVATVGFVSHRQNKKKAAKEKAAASVTPPPVFAAPTPAYTVKYKTDFSRHLNELHAITNNKEFFIKARKMLTKAVAEKLDSPQQSEQVLMKELVDKTCDAPVCKKAAALYESINLHLYAPYETAADLEVFFTEIKDVIEALQQEA